LAARNSSMPIITPQIPKTAATVHGVSTQRNTPLNVNGFSRVIAAMLAPMKQSVKRTKWIIKIGGLRQDANHGAKGPKRGRQAVETSLRDFGACHSVLIDRDGRIIRGNAGFRLKDRTLVRLFVKVGA